MKPKPNNIYCFDTSGLVTMHRYYPVRIIPDLWKRLEELFKQKKVISHDFVYDEIVPGSDIKDDLAGLISKHKIIAMVVEIMGEFSLFGKESDFVIVSTESENSPNKIPAVCTHYRVRHMNLFEFFEDNDWTFSLSKK